MSAIEAAQPPAAPMMSTPARPLATKRELAKALGVSVVTLDRWLDKYDVPCVERGTHGRPYQFDLEAALDFFRAQSEEEKQRQAERDEQLAQLALPLALPPSEDPGRLSLKEQADALRLRREQRLEAERLGLLVPAAELRDAITESMANFNRRLHGRINVLASMRSLPPEVTKALHDAINAAHAEFADECRQRVRMADAA
jgi:phage terminase Nu1 subunit (DNA packaging protein)